MWINYLNSEESSGSFSNKMPFEEDKCVVCDIQVAYGAEDTLSTMRTVNFDILSSTHSYSS